MGAIKSVIPFAAIACVIIGNACTPAIKAYKKLDDVHKNLADSLLLYALDHEGLYTLTDTLKPMSSVKMFRFPLAADSNHISATVPPLRNPFCLDTLAMYERVCRALSTAGKQWLLIPFKQPDEGYRNIQLYVINPKAFEKKVAGYPAFFGQFGISQYSLPAMVITHIENSNTYDRWRGYGYLFGYPGYAVDFFVTAGKKQKETGAFVERQFFHVPVYAADKGYFTYALEKDAPPSLPDSSIYKKASTTLDQYKTYRSNWVNSGKLKSKRILRFIYKSAR